MHFRLCAGLVTALILNAACVASAADVAMLFKAPVASPLPNWTGYYLGLNGGYAWQDRPVALNMNDPASINGISLVGSLSVPHEIDSGFVGFQAGYNWQFAPRWLAGIETDFQFGTIKGQSSLPLITSGGGVPGVVNFTESVQWFGTLRGRLGVMPLDNVLLFGTGGLAYGRVKRSGDFRTELFVDLFDAAYPHSFSCTGGGNVCFAGDSSQIQFGWTLGAGAEWALWQNITFKTEYLYVNLGHGSVTMNALALAPGGLVSSSMTLDTGDTDFHILRAGLNARF